MTFSWTENNINWTLKKDTTPEMKPPEKAIVVYHMDDDTYKFGQGGWFDQPIMENMVGWFVLCMPPSYEWTRPVKDVETEVVHSG